LTIAEHAADQLLFVLVFSTTLAEF
jgi:hypothetical protein